jgi:hypothetical protein
MQQSINGFKSLYWMSHDILDVPFSFYSKWVPTFIFPLDFCKEIILAKPYSRSVREKCFLSLGQSSPWTKHPRQICDKTSPFSGTDYSSLKIKLCTIFFAQNVPCCCLGSPDPAARHLRRGPGGPAPEPRSRRPGPGGLAPSGTAKNDVALAPTVPVSALRLHKNSGPVWSNFWTKFSDGFKCIAV